MPPDAATWSDRGLGQALGETRFTDLRWFDRLASTNSYALDAARGGVPEGLVVVADEQTAGRGRLGRRWVAPPRASLLVSIVLRPQGSEPQRVVMAAALALADAVESAAGFLPALKWPNDLIVGDRKLAGILAESDGRAIVVGAGCNVNWGKLPPELEQSATACDLEAGRPVDRVELLVRFLCRLDGLIDDLDGVADDYRARLDTLGRRVRVELPDGELRGEAVDLAPDGALLVRTEEGRRVLVRVGDVVHLRSGIDVVGDQRAEGLGEAGRDRPR